ncbi:tetratricopeptide repeat protein [Herbaspirillum autotrophicum]|uniref:tetratricopeptide repeat protein n=1 Tax=Herbaspirillum autotrophicum TaxID=180195 RepID=UPI00067B5552|nr:tetratricopeptide repeat protein [Herbaspirillum autotrophicum]
MTSETSPAVHNRLDRLLAFLKEDAGNDVLRVDAFEIALASGNLTVAADLIKQADQLQSSPEMWRMRAANLSIAQGRHEEAASILVALRNQVGEHPSFAQNLGLIASLRSDYQTCFDEIKSWADVEPATAIDPGLQELWLRCLHHLGRQELALRWTEERKAVSTLSLQALGIASLIALDANQLDKAREWAEQAISAGAVSVEAFLTASAMALMQQDANQASDYAQQVLQVQANNGRAWSSLGLAQMLNLELGNARASLEQATTFMPGHIGSWHALGWACLLQKDYAAAQRAFDTALELDHNFGETHGGLAVIAAMQGQSTVAKEHARRAQGLDPAGMSAQYALALLDGSINDEQSVRDFARKLMVNRRRSL